MKIKTHSPHASAFALGKTLFTLLLTQGNWTKQWEKRLIGQFLTLYFVPVYIESITNTNAFVRPINLYHSRELSIRPSFENNEKDNEKQFDPGTCHEFQTDTSQTSITRVSQFFRQPYFFHCGGARGHDGGPKRIREGVRRVLEFRV